MKCERVRKALSAYLDGEISSSACTEIEEHLAKCPECERRKHELSLVVESLGRLGRIEPSPGFHSQTMRRIRSAAEMPAQRKVVVRKLAAAFASCAAVGILILGWLILSANRSGPGRSVLSLTERFAATLLVDNGGDGSFDSTGSTTGRDVPDELPLLVSAAYPDDTPIEDMIEMLSDNEITEFRTVLVSLAQEE
jgi:hypothetical protein